LYKPYLTLQQFIANQRQVATGPPQAVISTEGTRIFANTLVTSYAGVSGITFDLIYQRAGSHVQAFALQYLNGAVQYGYIINASGELGRMTPPPYSPSELSSVQPQYGIDPVPERDFNGSRSSGLLCKGCKLLCSGVVGCLSQLEKAITFCAPLPEVEPICVLTVFGLCLFGGLQCRQLCDALCKCPPGQASCGNGCCCQACETFVQGKCQNSCTGSDVCFHNGCTLFCPPNEPPCEGACCGPGTYCCQNIGCCESFQDCCTNPIHCSDVGC
jgi:hypothetical protein